MRWFRATDRSSGQRAHDALRRRYAQIDLAAGDDEHADAELAAEADGIAEEILREDAQHGGLWFDRGLFAKWRRDWPAAQEHNTRSLELIPEGRREGEPAAWNLGIAATARRDWAAARRAWAAYGIQVGGAGDEPVDDDLGPAAVRLNPPLRYIGQRYLEIDGEVRDAEVVWGLRLDPARIRIASVPLPESGHRFGDVVLHDGEPQGARRSEGREYPVFDEIEVWERSPIPTLGVVVQGSPDDVRELRDELEESGLAVEDWTAEVGSICRACSDGLVEDHDHSPELPADGDRRLGMAGDVAEARRIVETWVGRAPGRASGDVVVELD